MTKIFTKIELISKSNIDNIIEEDKGNAKSDNRTPEVFCVDDLFKHELCFYLSFLF